MSDYKKRLLNYTIRYIKKQLKKGFSRKKIEYVLRKSGCPNNIMKKAFDSVLPGYEVKKKEEFLQKREFFGDKKNLRIFSLIIILLVIIFLIVIIKNSAYFSRGLPDLVITDYDVPSSVKHGEPFVVKGVVKNMGDKDILKPFSISIQTLVNNPKEPGFVSEEVEINELRINEEVPFSVTIDRKERGYEKLPVGEHTLTITPDKHCSGYGVCNESVSESDEDNLFVIGQISITP